jgi:hypothetical protein
MDSISHHITGNNLKKHHVYTLAYPDGKVFYVGKASFPNRIYAHEVEAKSSRTCNEYKVRVIRKIWANGEKVLRKKVAYFDTDEEASLYEIALIFFLPDLTNLTDGGEGAIGLIHSLESKQKMSQSRKGKPQSVEHARKRSISHIGKKRSIETRQKISKKAKQRPTRTLSAEHKQKISEANKGKSHPWSVNTIRKVNEDKKGKAQSAEHIRKRSEALKGRAPSEEARRKSIEALKGKPLSAEQKRKISIGNTSKKHSEATRRKISEATRGKPKRGRRKREETHDHTNE